VKENLFNAMMQQQKMILWKFGTVIIIKTSERLIYNIGDEK